ncbi:hypothetical protein HA466_0114150 [Hirschfeldia incana]|nr:hypothetical protein HA466_0114150 [Hirschfeldia incana]KAJ0253791.1 hypothetical protein HA466_0114150 [Hirschfeldia incana]KAJ0253792.1 hypothetical protein HA466_0114150 [Hirschfeldia incana]KAJ0253793.1 hypothetical protein HA466_0114150 [Hirschfeldia incana]KAJ0253794.1 hypothetical protein HA466_0114150 [Hirschfeldia incana]
MTAENNNRLPLQLKDLSLELNPNSKKQFIVIQTLCPPLLLLHVQRRHFKSIPLGSPPFSGYTPSILRFSPATVITTTELPYGSCLGSSAAFCVACIFYLKQNPQ